MIMRIKTRHIVYALALLACAIILLYVGRLSHYYTGTYVMNYGIQRTVMLNRQAQQVKNCDVLILGDSLVEGMFLESKEKSIFLMGIGGSKVENWTAWAPQLLDKIQTPTLIIALGVNNTARDIFFDKEEIIHNFKKLCELATMRGISHIVLSSVLPVGKNQELGHKTFDSTAIKDINEALKKLARDNSYVYLDCYEHFANEEGFMPESLTTDGVHLNEKGYQLWKKLLLGSV